MRMRSKFWALALLVSCSLAAAAPFFVFAATNPIQSSSLIDFELNVKLPTVSISTADITSGEAIALYVKGVYVFLVRAAAFFAVVMIAWGGFLWMTAAGEKGRVGEGQKIITNAIVGLVLALGSYTILYTINPKIKDLSAVNPTKITGRYIEAPPQPGVCCYAEVTITAPNGAILPAPVYTKKAHDISLDECKVEVKEKRRTGVVTGSDAFYCSKQGVRPSISRISLCWKNITGSHDTDPSPHCTTKTPLP